MNTPENPISNTSAAAKKKARPFRLKTALLVSAIFCAGLVIGAAGAAKFIHSKLEQFQKSPELLRERIIGRLSSKLSLDAEQERQVGEIFDRRHPKVVEYHQEVREKIHVEFEAIGQEIEALLNEDQLKIWQEMKKKIKGRIPPLLFGPTGRHMHGGNGHRHEK